MCFKTYKIPKCKTFENSDKQFTYKPTCLQPSREAMDESLSSGWGDVKTIVSIASVRQPPTGYFLNVSLYVLL